MAKPRVRVKAGSTAYVGDSFVNASQRLGVGSGGQMDGSTYTYNNLTLNRVLLENAYTTSWIVGAAIDAPADDMTRSGVIIDSTLEPKAENLLYAAMRDLEIWQRLGDCERWSRLFGGCIGYLMINGQNPATPLRIDTIGKGQFKGIMPFDRWVATPDAGRVVTEMGPSMGLPAYYRVAADVSRGIPRGLVIHHSRCIRFDGLKLPYFRRAIYQMWGASVIERLWDRLLAFDSATMGAAQLVFKAHLKTLSVENYRNLVANGGKMFEGFVSQVDHMRQFQNTDAISVIDAKDKFETHTYNFAGLDDILMQFGQQLGGALEMPMTRLFGQSPAGLNSTGEGDLRTYYDNTAKKQNTTLRRPVTIIFDVLARSVLGAPLPDGFTFNFTPLWQLAGKDKAEAGKVTTEAISTAYDKGLITQKVGMQELRASSRETGLFSNITDADIDAAEDTIPDPVETEDETPDPSEPGAEDADEA